MLLSAAPFKIAFKQFWVFMYEKGTAVSWLFVLKLICIEPGRCLSQMVCRIAEVESVHSL